MSASEYARDTGLLGERVVLAHAGCSTDEDLAVLAATGTHVANCAFGFACEGQNFPYARFAQAGVSTGIGTDNVDIVLNELDSLHNLDFVSETSVSAPKSLRLIRLGTSGALQADLEVGSLLCTSLALGLDGLLPFYDLGSDPGFDSWVAALLDAHPALKKMAIPTFNPAHPRLLQQLSLDLPTGITLTCAGFYAPQGRSLRLKPAFDDLIDPLSRFRFPDGSGITNMEMETSGLYGLSRLMGHQAVSVNAILANRSTGERCSDPERAIKQMIQTVLGRLL